MQNNNERGVLIPTNNEYSGSNNTDKNYLENNIVELPIYEMAVLQDQKGQLEVGGFRNDNIYNNKDIQQNISSVLNQNYNFDISNNLQEGQILGKLIFL